MFFWLRHYGLLTDSIAQLMLRGSYQGSRHPFISLYEMQPESWPYILQQTSSIISSGIFEVQALKDIKPFVIYILCYGLYETQISLLCLLMEKLHSEESSIKLLIGWLLEALLWQHTQQVIIQHRKYSNDRNPIQKFPFYRILRGIAQIFILCVCSIYVNTRSRKRMKTWVEKWQFISLLPCKIAIRSLVLVSTTVFTC